MSLATESWTVAQPGGPGFHPPQKKKEKWEKENGEEKKGKSEWGGATSSAKIDVSVI